MIKWRLPSAASVIFIFLLAQIPFSVGEWIAVGSAPNEAGIYGIVIQATYDGIVSNFPLSLQVEDPLVLDEYSSEGLEVEPAYPWSRTSPIELKYIIKVDGSENISMVSNNLSVYYMSGDTLLKSEGISLGWDDNGYWVTTINVPFKGEYKALLSVIVEKNAQIYGGNFMTIFDSENPSSELLIDYEIDKRVLIPAEQFGVELVPEFEGEIIPNLEIFKANIYGTIKELPWNQLDLVYSAEFTAPTTEGIYLMSIYADGQDYVNTERIYVAEISKSKSGRCPLVYDDLGSCTDMKDVRKCVSDYKSDIIQVTEEQLIECYESAGGDAAIVGAFVCDGNYKGDLDGDIQLDIGDLEVLQNLILPLSQSQRQDYIKCADYDRDGDVDESDLQCMTNVISQKWIGDLNGGICFDMNLDTPLKCDLNGDSFIDDADSLLIRDLVEAADNGIEMSEEILDSCDFDQDGRITQEDWGCLDEFSGMDLDDPTTLLTGQYITAKCMNIYTLDNCAGIRGDINGDYKIDEIDEILVMLVVGEQITGYNPECADVNIDGVYTEEDTICVLSYTAGDLETYYSCINCDEGTPSEYREIVEICNDGYDNDCDGLVDRTSTEPAVDDCNCGSHTDCIYNWDNDAGQVPGVSDGNVMVCRHLTWEDTGDAGASVNDGYRWVFPTEMNCQKDRECENVECKGTVWKCAFDGTSWDWYENPSDLEAENDDPLGAPKVCEDGYDNDCACGDKTCKELESGDMFSSWEFWVGVVAGAILSFVPGLNVLVVGLIFGFYLRKKFPRKTAHLSRMFH